MSFDLGSPAGAPQAMTIGKPESGTGDRFNASDHLGRLVLFAGHSKEVVPPFPGNQGDQTVARVELVVVLDHPEGPLAFSDVIVFARALAPAVYRSPAQIVLGRIGQGEAKAGQSPPWVLIDPTDAELAATQAWLPKYVKQTPSGYAYAPEEAPF